jgi:hypothetical protein
MKKCEAIDCGREDLTKGLCNKHYNRKLKGQDINETPEQKILRRFWGKANVTDDDNDCWEWKGLLNRGYGRLSVNGTFYLAHRYSYELANGPILNGLFCCHKCDNRKCVNPKHLFLGTHNDNMRDMSEKGRHFNSIKTHCKWGHEFTVENTGIWKRGGGLESRRCKTCNRVRAAKYYHRDRARKESLSMVT